MAQMAQPVIKPPASANVFLVSWV